MFFDEKSGKIKLGEQQPLKMIVPDLKPFELLTDTELQNGGHRTFVFDVESYVNYFLVGFKCITSGKIVYFELSPSGGFNIGKLNWILHRFLLIGFNSRNYDIPIIQLACQGLTAKGLNDATREIIFQELRPYELRQKFGLSEAKYNNIDLIDVAPITASLKIYSGRLHCKRMQDLPFKPEVILTEEQAGIVLNYNINDLDNTQLLYESLQPQLELREVLGKEYQQDLRSKSDAQIAEAVICSELEKTGLSIVKPKHVEPTFKYKAPEWLDFQSPQLNELLQLIQQIDFDITASGKPKFPQSLSQYKSNTNFLRIAVKEKDGVKSHVIDIDFYKNVFTVAMGGLHSNEQSTGYKADENTLLIDRDVASFYPAIVLNNSFFPDHLGKHFLSVYDGIVKRRLAAKRAGNKTISEGLKITVNGTFGKFGNRYSRLYSPSLVTQVTITGQLALLMLIEAIELADIEVISANTDGVVIKCPHDRYDDLQAVVSMWEAKTKFVTEETRYKAIYSRDVNNYIAVKEDGECKTKGVYCERGSALNSVLSKNPEMLICSDAVQKFLSKGIQIEETICNCADIRRFVSVRTVKGGAQKDGWYLGKAIRWYYAKGEYGTINYVESGNKVPKSEGAKPLMDLPDTLPDDLDYDRYINEANDILVDIGYTKKAAQASLF